MIWFLAELDADATKFDLVLHHKSVFSLKDQEWLQAYSQYNLTRDEQRVILLGKDAHLLSTNEIIKALGIADVDEFRRIVETLRRKGILYTALDRSKTLKALRAVRVKREVGRFAIRPADQTEQYRQELLRVLAALGEHSFLGTDEFRSIVRGLSSSSPYRENPGDSLKLLGLVDARMRALPLLLGLWGSSGSVAAVDQRDSRTSPKSGMIPTRPARRYVQRPAPRPIEPSLPPAQSPSTHEGKVTTLKYFEEYGFIRSGAGDYYFRRLDLVEPQDWPFLRYGTVVSFDGGTKAIAGRHPPAKRVRLVKQSAEAFDAVASKSK